ncbi:SUMF1/EgtB/PvdO family nonheme iron enzyme [Roseofilum casamattae]|uniref:SUMF1/EgtB/PvdO family nonheme iron enzyme n=1 Tax=Roseofilum casamattae BLCC-M143 TaxID=3022442 RepID=A0ABT7C0R5_9CYAN|nr:SUMF1/EgtB/PvdO family nonheme iron enzyme [Roseofilum casamattae]MDJ1185037.1 SUMF1/EgtB/PvdO family nonheme iron enzyme [Roseofilum casamattae BLCC-M143]
MEWKEGTLVAKKYRIERVLGRGGLGVTYKAQHETLGSYCAIKTPKTELSQDANYDEFVQRFRQEAQTLARLKPHPHIVRVFDLFTETDEENPDLEIDCLVMEFIEGESLYEKVRRRGALPEAEAVRYIRQVGSALVEMHKTGLVHFDATPVNIMIRPEGEAVLIDFGIAGDCRPSSISYRRGNDGFAPYEQFLGTREVTVDIYTLAASLYYAVVGKLPAQSMERLQNNVPLIRPDQHRAIDNGLNYAIMWGMALEAQDRPPSMERWLELPAFSDDVIPKTVKLETASGETSRANSIPDSGWDWSWLPWVNSSPSPAAQPTPPRRVSVNPTPIPTPNKTIRVSPPTRPVKAKPAPSPKLPRFRFETVQTNREGRVIRQEQREAEYFREDLGDGVFLDMVAIPGGKFLMGSPKGEGLDNEKPQHWVTVPPFFMGKFLITQAQWRRVASFPQVRRSLKLDPSRFKGKDLPVEHVSWYDSEEFCARLGRQTGKPYTLPSEAQWEYACRAGTQTPFAFGETLTADLANFDRQYNQTTPVGQFPPNRFGLYDMHGNVWEWCGDRWHNDYTHAPANGSVWLNSDKGNKGRRVIRGGSWNFNPRFCRSAFRINDYPDNLNDSIGLRVIRFPPPRTK